MDDSRKKARKNLFLQKIKSGAFNEMSNKELKIIISGFLEDELTNPSGKDPEPK
jgi:hypothetical protein